MTTTSSTCIELQDPRSSPLPSRMPLVPVRQGVVFPGVVAPLAVVSGRSAAAVQEAAASSGHLFLAPIADDLPEGSPPHGSVGIISSIIRVCRGVDETSVVLRGVCKGRVVSLLQEEPYCAAEVEEVPGVALPASTETDSLLHLLEGELQRLAAEGGPGVQQVCASLKWGEAGAVELLAAHLGLQAADARPFLEMPDPLDQLKLLIQVVRRERELLGVERAVRSSISERMEKSRRSTYLREQLRAVRDELALMDGGDEEAEEWRGRLHAGALPEGALQEGLKRLGRLAALPQGAQADALRDWLELLLALPWSAGPGNTVALERVKAALDGRHLYLQEAKQRVLELVSAASLGSGFTFPVLCLTGSRGVGKSTFARSIADALGRPSFAVQTRALGEESALKGSVHHRNPAPGIFVRGLREAGSPCCVFILEELDALGGEGLQPQHASFLDIFDPERRSRFLDRYLGVPFDFSPAVFIATATQPESIPAPLRDRMEMLFLSGYSDEEKLDIALNKIVPAQLEIYGLAGRGVRFASGAVRTVIAEYTSEAGVRRLERVIGTVCSKITRMIADGEDFPRLVTIPLVRSLLGKSPIVQERCLEMSHVGVATALAWTSGGGEIIFIEATVMEGRGGVMLTGSLGEVMKESAETAISYIHSRASRYGLRPDLFSQITVHVHIPTGAMPKDGPSAGITIAAALLSSLLGIPVRRSVAMTGEITLRGRILPVGGVREKLLGAVRAGVETLVIPERNLDDLKDIPLRVLRRIRVVPVKTVAEVFPLVLEDFPFVPE